MKINKKNFHIYYAILWIIGTIFFGKYVFEMCYYRSYVITYYIALAVSFLGLPWFFRDNCAGIIVSAILSYPILNWWFVYYNEKKLYKGPSFVCKFYTTSYSSYGHGKGTSCWLGYIVLGNDTIKMELKDRGVVQSCVYVIYNVKCKTLMELFNSNKLLDNNINRNIQDFAFVENDSMYTYHDYSIKQPDLVYYQTGFNVVYKATYDGEYLHFVDVCKKNLKVKYTNGFLPDTFLVYRNVNEEIDDRFIVCAPEINTPENWSKISDYGYIFHYDIYRKEEIETQCPQIKNYVEKFKERNINSNEN